MQIVFLDRFLSIVKKTPGKFLYLGPSQPLNNFFEVRHRKWGEGNKKTLKEISRSDGLVIGLDELG